MENTLEKIKGGLIVSCQALEDEPLHSSYIMSRMACAAMEGGAVGIRANSVEDITMIKKSVNLPMIAIIKREYSDSHVYITPTMDEVDALVSTGAEIIAMDATARIRPGNMTLEHFFKQVRDRYPDQLFMADCSSVEEGMAAADMGFDLIGTTLAGYTDYTRGTKLPAIDMIRELVGAVSKPVIAEGGIWTTQDLTQALDTGAHAAVIGTAITRPRDITRRFVNAIQK